MRLLVRRWPYLAGGTGWLALAVHSVVAGGWAWSPFNDWLYNGLLVFAAGALVVRAVRIRDERTAWGAMAAAVGAWTAADIYYTVAFPPGADVPFPSWADFGFLAFYPFAYVSLVTLVRSRITHLPTGIWVDALIAGFGTAALGASLVIEPVMHVTHGSIAVVATNLAYPIGDTLLVAMIVAVFAIANFRAGRAWAVLGLGLLISGVADSIYLVTASNGTYTEGGLLDAMWPLGMLLLAAAAWEPTRRRSGRNVSQMLVTPGAFGLLAVALGIYDHFGRVNAVGVFATAATFICVMARAALAIIENRRLLERSQGDAITDALTGLGNRRRLTLDLDACARAIAEGTSRSILGLFDLDGFKGYNDRFGHPAGDALLERLARKLDVLVRQVGGVAYRMGGDEFCVLLPAGPEIETILAQCRVALSEQGEGFAVTSSLGVVVMPDEAATQEEALRVADHRLYASKSSSRASALSQSKDVLVRVLTERQSELGHHVTQVAELAELTALRLGLSTAGVSDTRLAAELHDVGKTAIPDAILNKAGALNETEWEFVRRHTVVGQRIVAAAPALAEVGRIVRSSHERMDGSGYPDGLAGDEIPLPSRIVSVADAYDAMTSDRSYAAARSSADALAELRRCAGTHFDASVVEAFAGVLADLELPGPVLEAEQAGAQGTGTPPGAPAEASSGTRRP